MTYPICQVVSFLVPGWRLCVFILMYPHLSSYLFFQARSFPVALRQEGLGFVHRIKATTSWTNGKT